MQNTDLAKLAEERLDFEPALPAAVREWLGTLQEAIDRKEHPGRIEHVGRIVRVADGVAVVSGLANARFNELLRFPGNVYGLVFNLDIERIGCVLLGDDTNLAAGDPVHLTGRVVSVPVGDGLLGRVVDSLGRPLDGEGGVEAAETRPIEKEAPAILSRRPVVEQLVTGVKTVDAMIPIGRGQRELIVGDRATGKTALAVDTILSQRRTDVISIYVAIGQKVSTVRRAVNALHKNDAFRNAVVVSADADAAPGLQYIAPYAATTMAEYFMEQGRDVVVIYDDLTRHARAYRAISLLLRRPPGREAYPGDIFFIHSRLLERATRLTEEAGGGSLTALPIVETQAKNLSAYIPTNLISITDGQIFLDPDLFYKGVKPAINVGLSVSRVGGKTQLPALRKVAQQLRLEYAQFSELEIFTRFGATVVKETQRKIERGRRIREVLKQQRLNPLTGGEQALIMLAVQRGFIDDIPVDKLAPFEKRLRDDIAPRHDDVLAKVDDGEELTDDEWETLAQSVESAASEYAETEENPQEEGATDIAEEEPEGREPEAEDKAKSQKDEPEKPGEGKPEPAGDADKKPKSEDSRREQAPAEPEETEEPSQDEKQEEASQEKKKDSGERSDAEQAST